MAPVIKDADESSSAEQIDAAIHARCALPILIGAICMVRLKCYWCAVGACVLALVPFFGPCYVVAIPFGFWGLLALRDPEVRAAFAGTVREEASVEGARG